MPLFQYSSLHRWICFVCLRRKGESWLEGIASLVSTAAFAIQRRLYETIAREWGLLMLVHIRLSWLIVMTVSLTAWSWPLPCTEISAAVTRASLVKVQLLLFFLPALDFCPVYPFLMVLVEPEEGVYLCLDQCRQPFILSEGSCFIALEVNTLRWSLLLRIELLT